MSEQKPLLTLLREIGRDEVHTAAARTIEHLEDELAKARTRIAQLEARAA